MALQYPTIKELFTAIADELRDRLGIEGKISSQNIPDQVNNLYFTTLLKGREEGQTQGYKQGYNEGYAKGDKDGQEVGYNNGLAKGFADGKEAGLTEGKDEVYTQIEPINAQLENTLNGTDTGGKSYYDEFWDLFQNYGNKTCYTGTFKESGYEYIRPKYKIKPTSAEAPVYNMVMYSRKLKKIEAKYFDFSQVPYGTQPTGGFTYTFCSCSSLEEIEDVGLPPSYVYSYTFAYCSLLHTIGKITVDENTRFDNPFANNLSLENLTIAGTIGQNGFNVQWSTKLSKASIISIINALSTTASGNSVTLSKVAVESAFGSTASEEWISLINTRSNWTINLV
jgi:hypothetical protein